ncbi:AUGMIN subunit [Trifolium repens]|nr:AUGMIN subunit [Trifolium repens]
MLTRSMLKMLMSEHSKHSFAESLIPLFAGSVSRRRTSARWRYHSRDSKDRIIARLQQPYSLDCIPVEAEYQVGYII